MDGNKRVAIQACILLLELNGLQNRLGDIEGYRKTLEVAASKLSEHERDAYIEQLAGWLKARFI